MFLLLKCKFKCILNRKSCEIFNKVLGLRNIIIISEVNLFINNNHSREIKQISLQ